MMTASGLFPFASALARRPQSPRARKRTIAARDLQPLHKNNARRTGCGSTGSPQESELFAHRCERPRTDLFDKTCTRVARPDGRTASKRRRRDSCSKPCYTCARFAHVSGVLFILSQGNSRRRRRRRRQLQLSSSCHLRVVAPFTVHAVATRSQWPPSKTNDQRTLLDYDH